MKKILMVTALFLLLAGCSGGKENGSSTGGSASEMVRSEPGLAPVADNVIKPEQPNKSLPETGPKPERLKRKPITPYP